MGPNHLLLHPSALVCWDFLWDYTGGGLDAGSTLGY